GSRPGPAPARGSGPGTPVAAAAVPPPAAPGTRAPPATAGGRRPGRASARSWLSPHLLAQPGQRPQPEFLDGVLGARKPPGAGGEGRPPPVAQDQHVAVVGR